MFRVAYAILRNVQDSDDAVQDTFMKLYRSRGWDRIEDEKAYLARAVWRIAVDLRAKRPKSAECSLSAPGRLVDGGAQLAVASLLR